MTENSQPNKQSELDLELVKQAKLLFYDERKQILLGFRELDLQSYLKENLTGSRNLVSAFILALMEYPLQ